jgi:hypothetical protein
MNSSVQTGCCIDCLVKAIVYRPRDDITYTYMHILLALNLEMSKIESIVVREVRLTAHTMPKKMNDCTVT